MDKGGHLERFVVIRQILRVKRDPLLARVGELHADGDEVWFANLDVEPAEDRLDGVTVLPWRIAAQEQDQRLRLVARVFAGNAEGPARVGAVTIPLRSDRADLAVGVNRFENDESFNREVAG